MAGRNLRKIVTIFLGQKPGQFAARARARPSPRSAKALVHGGDGDPKSGRDRLGGVAPSEHEQDLAFRRSKKIKQRAVFVAPVGHRASSAVEAGSLHRRLRPGNRPNRVVAHKKIVSAAAKQLTAGR